MANDLHHKPLHGHCDCSQEHTHDHCSCGHTHAHTHDHEDCGCNCGHDHDRDSCDCGHDHGPKNRQELPILLAGAGLFAVGLLLDAFRLPGWPVYISACLLLGWPILTAAFKNLFRGHVFDENFLMSSATVGAFVIGEFPEAVGILLFYRAGEYFEHRAAARSRSQILEAADLRPDTVTLADGTSIPAEQAKVGQILLIRPGDRIGLDGTVVTGQSRIDTAPITGEPVPVAVGPGDPVISGCINTQGQLTVRAEKPLSESMVTRILRSVEGAAAQKPRIQRFISRFARVYTPVVVALAVAVAVLPSVLSGDWNYWIYTAISFLVMSCPCALVLSVPLAFFCGIGAGSKKGILFKDGSAIEALARVRAVALDKTGTLTQGQFRVQPCDEALLRLCASCEQFSTHPIAVSICIRAGELGLELDRPEQVQEIPGRGICALLEGRQVLCGNARLLADHGIDAPAGEGTLVHVAADGRYLGTLTVADSLKSDAVEAVRALQKRQLAVAMLTGDREESARSVADAAGIKTVHARLLPEEKLTALQTLRKTFGPVLFVGDGINDAPVLAGADVGGAMGSGTDAAMEAADVVFLGSQVRSVADAVSIAKRTQAIAWQNVCFALGVKMLVMVLGLCGLANLWLAVFADTGMAILCVLNAIRLLYTTNRNLV